MSRNNAERRVAHVDLELRKRNGIPTISGHAAVFGSLSSDLGGFREKIAPGAFSRAIRDKHDTRALFNHDPNRVLGRTPKTLRLREDSVGLKVEIDPPKSEAGLLELMERGDVSQMSFGFVVTDDAWDETPHGNVRTVRDVDLLDVSVVTYPAYAQTDAAVRSLERWRSSYDSEQAALHRLNALRLELERARGWAVGW